MLLPDCFSDPLVRAELPAELQTALPPLDFLRDLISVPSGQLQSLIALLRPSPTDLIDGGVAGTPGAICGFLPSLTSRASRPVGSQRRSRAGSGLAV